MYVLWSVRSETETYLHVLWSVTSETETYMFYEPVQNMVYRVEDVMISVHDTMGQFCVRSKGPVLCQVKRASVVSGQNGESSDCVTVKGHYCVSTKGTRFYQVKRDRVVSGQKGQGCIRAKGTGLCELRQRGQH